MDKIDLVQTNDVFEIYSDLKIQFPPSERKSFECFKKLIDGGLYRAFNAVLNNEKVGYAVFLFDETRKTLWLDYLAVFKAFHCKGYGHLILDAFKKFNEKGSYKGCWLEVEKPDEKLPDTIRRIKFYEKAGAKKIDCNYLYPNAQGYLPMDLYFLPFIEDFVPSCELMNESITYTFDTLHCELPHAKEIASRIIFK